MKHVHCAMIGLPAPIMYTLATDAGGDRHNGLIAIVPFHPRQARLASHGNQLKGQLHDYNIRIIQ